MYDNEVLTKPTGRGGVQPEEKTKTNKISVNGRPLANCLHSPAFGKDSFGLPKNNTAIFTYLKRAAQAIPSGGDCRSLSMLDFSSTPTPVGRTAKAFSMPFNLWKRAKMENLNMYFYSLN